MQQRFPVVVYFHGGEFKFGGKDYYKPDILLRQDVILVVPNYRLGILGMRLLHFCHSFSKDEMTKRNDVSKLRKCLLLDLHSVKDCLVFVEGPIVQSITLINSLLFNGILPTNHFKSLSCSTNLHYYSFCVSSSRYSPLRHSFLISLLSEGIS
jgi:hypothetical protein